MLNQNPVKYLKEKEVSQIVGLALPTLRNQRSRGKGIPYSKIGRSVRYLYSDILEYMNSRKIRNEE